jgi:hypothetical protein
MLFNSLLTTALYQPVIPIRLTEGD